MQVFWPASTGRQTGSGGATPSGAGVGPLARGLAPSRRPRVPAKAVGVARSTPYRWEKQAAPKSRCPRRARLKTWTPELRQAVERLRRDFPMWGRAKLERECHESCARGRVSIRL
jgi:hypothetical protein